MLVKIGDKIFNPSDEPISIYLTDEDKLRIGKMPAESHYYSSHPREKSKKEMDAFIEQFKQHIASAKDPWIGTPGPMVQGKYSQPETLEKLKEFNEINNHQGSDRSSE